MLYNSGEERYVRLEQMREVIRERRASETSGQREVRLQQEMRDRLGAESPEHREASWATADKRPPVC